MIKIAVIIVISLTHVVVSQFEAQSIITCPASYCEDNADAVKCQEPRNCSTVGFRKFLSPKRCNCCSYCYDYLGKDESCTVLIKPGPPNEMCGPLLQCVPNDPEDPDNPKCERMTRGKGTCIGELNEFVRRKENGSGGIADFEPSCNNNGNYNPRQCLPSSSSCMCMNENGEGIFGIGSASSPMDCACARDVDTLSKIGVLKDPPHCLANGDYDQLQCSLKKRSCYCRLQPTKVVPLANLKDLFCYDPKIHFSTYRRWCELEKSSYDSLIYDAELNNTEILIGEQVYCDPDGTYAPVQSRSDKWVCVDPFNEPIEEFRIDKRTPNPPPQMDCRCARVRSFLGESGTGRPKCCVDGSYRPWQCIGSICFCVDKIGRQDMSKIPAQVPRDEVDTLTCYKNSC